MESVDLNRPIQYYHASFYRFAPGEHHVSRFCRADVLLLVFEGCLRFSEEEEPFEVTAGEYFIQRNHRRQSGPVASDSPNYLYVHFFAEWGDEASGLPRRGHFSPEELMPLMKRLDSAARNDRTRVEQTALFFQILTALYRGDRPVGKGEEIARYLRENSHRKITLEEVAKTFGYSKNQIINILRESCGETPVSYLNRIRIKNAEWLMQVSPKSLSQVAAECGFGDYSRFYKVFFSHHGCSPAQWREKHRE